MAAARQPGVTGVGNGLGHDRGVDHCDFQAFRSDDTGILAQGDAHCQKFTGSVFANAVAEPHHGGFVHREPVLEDHFAAELLPVGVFHPAIQNIPVGQSVHVLEKLQAHVQADGKPRTPGLHRVQLTKMLLASRPVDPLAHLHQFVPGVEDVFEVGFQQVSLRCLAFIPWDHGLFFRFLGETGRFVVEIIP